MTNSNIRLIARNDGSDEVIILTVKLTNTGIPSSLQVNRVTALADIIAMFTCTKPKAQFIAAKVDLSGRGTKVDAEGLFRITKTTAKIVPFDIRQGETLVDTIVNIQNYLEGRAVVITDKTRGLNVEHLIKSLRKIKVTHVNVNSQALRAFINKGTPLKEEQIEELENASFEAEKIVEADPKEAEKWEKAAAPKWLKELPDPKEFFVQKDVWTQCCYNVAKGKNLLLVGPSGGGKSELVYELGKAFDMEVAPFNMGAMTEPRSALIGTTHLVEGEGTKFIESRFIPAITKGTEIVLLDELTRATIGAFNILLPLLDNQRILSLDEAEDTRVIKRCPESCIIATANIGMEYTGTDALDKALKDRFSSGYVEVFFPPMVIEAGILTHRTGVEGTLAKKLALFAQNQRESKIKRDTYSEFVSTRMLLEACFQVAEGVPEQEAAKFCIVNHFAKDTEEGSERHELAKLFTSVTGIKVSA